MLPLVGWEPKIMRQVLCAALSVAALAAASQAAAAEPVGRLQPRAISVQRYAANAEYRTPSKGHGYSREARHVADCLASHPGYDPKLDIIKVKPGVVRRCML